MVLKQHGVTREQPPRLLVLLMEGCSGSTFVTQTASQLLECAGTAVVAAGELMKPRGANGWWNNYHNWSLALEVMHRDAGEFGKAFIINADIKSARPAKNQPIPFNPSVQRPPRSTQVAHHRRPSGGRRFAIWAVGSSRATGATAST